MVGSERAGQPARHGGPQRASGPEGEVLLEPDETCAEGDLAGALAKGRGRNKSLPNRPCREEPADGVQGLVRAWRGE